MSPTKAEQLQRARADLKRWQRKMRLAFGKVEKIQKRIERLERALDMMARLG